MKHLRWASLFLIVLAALEGYFQPKSTERLLWQIEVDLSALAFGVLSFHKD